MDYEKIGFKAGLEVHQQLDSGKLFCRCPSILRKDEPDFEVKRNLHLVAGETGEVDVAAKYQAGLKKDFIYQGYNDTTCLVELDEEPAQEINREALEIAVQISLLMECDIVPITQIMRKIVIDGSNTSGFQRTVMIAHSGKINTSKGVVGISAVMLEEDSARIILREEKKETYRLDRLGIPLVEIVTAPDIKDSEHAREVALKIGDVLRSCRVKRGLGTIRQDVSISVNNANRVELKGVQDIDLLPTTIKNEVKRQLDLEKNKSPTKPEVRNALPDGTSEFLRPMPGSARMYPETDLPILKISRDFINECKKTLPELKSETEEKLRKQGLSQEIIKEIFKTNKLNEYRELFEIFGNSGLIGRMMFTFPKEISAKEKKPIEEIYKKFNQNVLAFILEKMREGELPEARVKEVFIRISEGEELKKAVVFEEKDSEFIEEEIMKIVKSKPGLNPNAYMGLVMSSMKGKISGNEAMEIIKKYI